MIDRQRICSPDDGFLEIGPVEVHQVLVDEANGYGNGDEDKETSDED